MPLDFVNIDGKPMNIATATAAAGKKKRAPAKKTVKPPKSYHNGWRVTGLPPGAMEKAKEAHAKVVDMAARAGGRLIPAFDPVSWLAGAKLKPVRSKPYEIQSAAMDCKALAEKAGWTNVQINELKLDLGSVSV